MLIEVKEIKWVAATPLSGSISLNKTWIAVDSNEKPTQTIDSNIITIFISKSNEKN